MEPNLHCQRILSGVPQVSVIRLLLFLILIGNIDELITFSFLSSFVDRPQNKISDVTREHVRQNRKLTGQIKCLPVNMSGNIEILPVIFSNPKY